METLNIPKDHPSVRFAQIYGMCDHISFGLGKCIAVGYAGRRSMGFYRQRRIYRIQVDTMGFSERMGSIFGTTSSGESYGIQYSSKRNSAVSDRTAETIVWEMIREAFF